MDAGPRSSVAGLGHKGVCSGGSGRDAVPGPGRKGPVQNDQRRHDEPDIGLQRRHPPVAPELPPTE